MKQLLVKARAWRCVWTIAVVGALAAPHAGGQDQLVEYFPGSVAGVGNLGAQTFDANDDFWVISLDRVTFGVPVPRLAKVELVGGNWVSSPHALGEDLTFFYRSSDGPAGLTNPLWGGPAYGTPQSFLLNPAPLTIDVPTPTGVQAITYQPGELTFITDAMGLLSDQNSVERAEHTKKIWRYDLRKVDNPNGAGISGPTSSQPDFATASNGDGTDPVGDVVFGALGLTDWNDAFTQVISEADLRAASGGVAGSDNFGRSFAWSSDGQSIYAVDAGSNTGGIYKIDATQTGVVERIRTDTSSQTIRTPNQPPVVTTRIITEPGVVPTSVRDFDPSDPRVGDQIIVMGSADGGNQGGLNAYLDDGSGGQLADPAVVFSNAEFRSFADYYAVSEPQYTSVHVDESGNLYFSESRTDGVFRYDTQGRFVKVLSEREHNVFQQAAGLGPNDTVLDLQHRTSMGPGFEVVELIYTDDSFDAPIGIYVFEPGDFDRDNDVDAADLAEFGAALRPRNVAAQEDDPLTMDVFEGHERFDLNGNEVAFRGTNPNGTNSDPSDDFPDIRHRTGEQVVVDWKDVKILQQFVDLPDGDANFDLALDFSDLDIVGANYFTVSSSADKTWIDGDFGSVDPEYLWDVADANLVNEVDLGILADAWLNDLGQAAPTEAELASRYSGQFLTDAIAAFAVGGSGGLDGDYDGDGDVDALDYVRWASDYGDASPAADGNGDGVVNAADYTVWRDHVTGDYNGDGVVNAADYTIWRDTDGQTGSGLAADSNGDAAVDIVDYNRWRAAYGGPFAVAFSSSVPEPTAAGLALVAGMVAVTRGWRRR